MVKISKIKKYLYSKKAQKFFNEWGKKTLIVVFIMFILDSLSTYYSVLYEKIAFEGNPSVLFLWGKFGIVVGEFIRIISFILIFGLIYLKYDSKNPKVRILAYCLTVFCFMAWFFTLINNFSIILNP